MALLRPAGRADRAALERFTCWRGGEPSFIRDVQSSIRTGGWKATVEQRALVVEHGGAIIASARHRHESVDGRGVRWIEWVAICCEWQAQSIDGRRASDAVSEFVLADARTAAGWWGDELIACRIHVDNVRSQRVSQRNGWVRASPHLSDDTRTHEAWAIAV